LLEWAGLCQWEGPEREVFCLIGRGRRGWGLLEWVELERVRPCGVGGAKGMVVSQEWAGLVPALLSG
jgi:hypothetical protein